MVSELHGDLLEMPNGILCHQTNFYGVMGAGVAYAISTRLLTPEQYTLYSDYCNTMGRNALGTVQLLSCPGDRVVANLFCQDDRAQPGSTTLTDYDAMRKCFEQVKFFADNMNKPVYVPYKIGCGIAGGDWEKVRGLLDEIFSDKTVNLTIVRRDCD